MKNANEILNIPHKDWSGDPRERRNYETIEQWSYRLPGCYPPQPPPPTTDLSHYSQHFYGNQTVPDGGPTTPYPQRVVNWTQLTGAADYSPSPAFRPNVGNISLPIHNSGLLLWNGHVIWNTSGTADAGYTQTQLWFIDTDAYLQQYDQREGIPNGAPGLLGAAAPIVHLGGGYYVPPGDTLELHLIQWSGTTRTVLIDLYFSYITEAPVS